MKRFIISALGLASASSLCAQSLFDLAPDSSETESLPLTWTVSVGLGYDDNPTPLIVGSDSSSYGTANVGVSFLTNTPQTTLEFFARVGVIHYFDNLPGIADDTTGIAGLGVNWTHRVSERLRFSSRNVVTHELEPDHSVNIGAPVQAGAYTRWSTDNSVGYRWTERLATYTGFTFTGLDYEDVPGNDVTTFGLYNQFRYQLSPQSVLTFSYRYSEREVTGPRDSSNHILLAGIEHRFNPNTIGILRVGAQIRDVDFAPNSDTSPNVEASLNSQVNEQLMVRAYARYSVEDYSRNIGLVNFADSEVLRLGVEGRYRVSEPLSIRAGVNYQDISYENGTGPLTADEDIINFYIGFNLKVAENIWLSGNYNYEDFSSSFVGRDFDRNRFSLSVSTEF